MPLVGSVTPRVFTPPLRPLEPRSAQTETYTLGYAACDFARADLGLALHPWQEWLLVHLLELTPRGDLRFRTVVVLVARQNGKTTLSVVIALFFMYLLGRKLVIGTAQDLDVAEAIWQSAVDLVTELSEDETTPVRPDLHAMVGDVVQTNGKKSLVLTTGEKYKVKAPNRRAGRSLSSDLILLDELREHRSWAAWGALTKTTMARAFALILCLSNAGDDASVVLNKLRLMAHMAIGNPDGLEDEGASAGVDMDDLLDEYGDDLGLFEWSAPPGCAMDDRGAWCWSNPSLGSPVETEFVVTERAIASALRTDPEDVFRAEVLCQTVLDSTDRKITIKRWGELKDEKSQLPIRQSWALDVAPDRLSASICAAGDRGDGKRVVYVAEVGAGDTWILATLKTLRDTKGLRQIAISTASPAANLITKIEALGIEVDEFTSALEGRACGDLVDAVIEGTIVHLDDPILLEALLSAGTRDIGDGLWGWRRKGSANITPLVGITLALAASLANTTPFFASWR